MAPYYRRRATLNSLMSKTGERGGEVGRLDSLGQLAETLSFISLTTGLFNYH